MTFCLQTWPLVWVKQPVREHEGNVKHRSQTLMFQVVLGTHMYRTPTSTRTSAGTGMTQVPWVIPVPADVLGHNGSRTSMGISHWLRSLYVLVNVLWAINFPNVTLRYGTYRKTSYISHTLVGNKFVDHSDVVGAAPVCRRCSNYIFILDLTPGFNGLGKDHCKRRQDIFKFWDLVRLILEVLRLFWSSLCPEMF